MIFDLLKNPPINFLKTSSAASDIIIFGSHAWPTYLPLSQSMPGNSVLNLKWGSHANKIQKILQVWKHLGYWAFRPRYGMGNGPQLTMLPFFSSEVIPDFPVGSSCPPRPIFTLSAEKAFWIQGIDKRHDSFLGEVPET